MSKTIKVGWMFENTFSLHGDRGNILAIEKMCKDNNLDVEIVKLDFDLSENSISDMDMLFFPPGEIINFPPIVEALTPLLGELEDFISAGKPLLAVGTTMTLFGKKIVRCNGNEVCGLGLLDIVAHEKDVVYGDDVYYAAEYNGKTHEIIGVQIQMIDLDIQSEKPFGKLFYGYGNTGKDQFEGVIKENAIFTSALGPVLVTNIWLTKAILEIILKNKGIEGIDIKGDFELEQKSFELKKNLIMTKKTKLTNCPR